MAYNGYGLGGGQENAYCVEPPKPIECECGKVYKPFSRSVHQSFVNGKANGCISCKPERYQREIAKAKARCLLKLARHIAGLRNRTIYRDVAVRYIQRFGGSTFGVRKNAIDDIEIYLENPKGQILGEVSYLDKYPKPPAKSEFADMPF